MKYATLRKYVRFFALKPVKCVPIGCFFLWPVIGGFLFYSKVLPNLDWLNFGVSSVFLAAFPASPRRRRVLRTIVSKPTFWGWRRRSRPGLYLIGMHFWGPLFIFVYFGLSQSDAPFILPAIALLAASSISLVLLFWRPLILRVLFGFDKRTKLFGILG